MSFATYVLAQFFLVCEELKEHYHFVGTSSILQSTCSTSLLGRPFFFQNIVLIDDLISLAIHSYQLLLNNNLVFF